MNTDTDYQLLHPESPDFEKEEPYVSLQGIQPTHSTFEGEGLLPTMLSPLTTKLAD
ncbi:hypothetical protein ACKUB1_00975 [Methanospirillum stamsii]|uniref:hypothetical protein n=1 Tax=Methanospirillum stamsii TaxID=1277351 RepID=UPI0015E82BE2|nr:hypothetical protein [Methanospirillum stamsii]